MKAVEKVEQLNDTTIRWTAEIAGVKKMWTAKITQQEPDQRVAWTAIEGAKNAGVVTFHRLADRKTRITLQLDVEPDGPVESVGDALGFVARQAKEDLKHFKEFIEQQGVATGAWRRGPPGRRHRLNRSVSGPGPRAVRLVQRNRSTDVNDREAPGRRLAIVAPVPLGVREPPNTCHGDAMSRTARVTTAFAEGPYREHRQRPALPRRPTAKYTPYVPNRERL